jgi:hypothetical protein
MEQSKIYVVHWSENNKLKQKAFQHEGKAEMFESRLHKSGKGAFIEQFSKEGV